jgi:ribosomal protein L32
MKMAVAWSPAETDVLEQMMKKGCDWNSIAQCLPGRTADAVRKRHRRSLPTKVTARKNRCGICHAYKRGHHACWKGVHITLAGVAAHFAAKELALFRSAVGADAAEGDGLSDAALLGSYSSLDDLLDGISELC